MAMTDHTSAVERLVADADRASDLASRLVAPGPKAAHVSASETHEIAEWVHDAVHALAAIKQDSEAGAVVVPHEVAQHFRILDQMQRETGMQGRFAEAEELTQAYAYFRTLHAARPAAALPEVTDAMVTTAARAICKRNSEMCGVDNDDNWKLYADDFKADARAALTAALRPETQGGGR